MYGRTNIRLIKAFANNTLSKSQCRQVHLTAALACYPKEPERVHPFLRTIRVLGGDLFGKKDNLFRREEGGIDVAFPSHVDVLIVGGGAIGSSAAYWLKEKAGMQGLSVAVIEKDHTYKASSTVLSVGGLRQQFSLPENIHMSLFGAEFLRTIKKRFGSEADVYFTPHGYLILASESGAQQLMDNSKLQNQLGAINKICSKEELKSRFPWMNVDDVALGCLGLEKEGWFDPWALLCLLKKGAIDQGTHYITGEVEGFEFSDNFEIEVEGVAKGEYEGIRAALVKLPNGDVKNISFAYVVIAAGAESGKVTQMAKIGTGTGMLTVPLPVERRKRYVYCFECQGQGPTINTPMTIDYTGAYFRRDGLGGSYIGGLSPQPEDEPPTDNLDVDHNYFDEKVWPILAHRVPAFNSIKVKSGWSGFYEYNFYDENGIVGPHPYYHNLYLATGFSGHGIQQAPAIGRAVAEMLLDGGFQTIDLTRFGFDRLMVDQRMLEANIF